MSAQDEKHRSHLPMPNTGRKGLITFDAKDPASKFPPIERLRPPKCAPNVLIVLIDGVGFDATSRFITDRVARFLFQVSQLQGAIRSGLVRKADVRFPLEWYVEKRICPHKKLLLAYIAENSTSESKQFFESLDAWQRCSSD